MNSHIQMPELILKRFANKSNLLYYYQVEGGFIGNHGTAASMNTQEGYFSEATEQYLNKYIEQPFSKLIEEIEKYDFSLPQIEIPSNLDELSKKYAYSLILRDKYFPDEVKKHSYFGQFLPEETTRNFIVQKGLEIAKENKILYEYKAAFLVNDTNIGLVLPNCGCYNYTINGKSVINFPIGPFWALAFIKPNEWDVIPVLHIKNEEHIHFMNSKAFDTQINHNWGWVYSNKKEELDLLKEEYESHLSSLKEQQTGE